jgi:hypothetical protein
MKRLQIGGAAVLSAVTAMLINGSTGALAATGSSSFAAPGAVRYPTLISSAEGNLHVEVVCTDDAGPIGSPGWETITVIGPSVYGAALADGSRAQWVTYRVDLVDVTARAVTYSAWTAWKVASTTVPVQMPTMSGRTGEYHTLVMEVDLLWSEGGSTYSGGLSYEIQNSYSSAEGDSNASTHQPGTFCK